MTSITTGFVRTDLLPPQPAPRENASILGWVRANLLATPKDALLTVLAVALLLWTVPGMLNWLFFDAV
ncbi:MAG TPA: amino acid ABC transporter permease, partial [Pseudorhizobium sp.]|nr:amino acid ABC transporter permease [Pseudorhizobium sp.]